MSSDSKPVEPVHGVFYTDGGYRPSIKLGGWGIHGYLFTDVEPKRGTGCKAAVITRKGYLPNEQAGKISKSDLEQLTNITITGYVNGFGTLMPETTNNIAEVTALIRTLEFAVEQNLASVLVRPDSKYTMEGYRDYMDTWAKRDWCKADGNPVANRDLWMQLLALRNKLRDQGVEVEFLWVKGHSGELGNDTADMNATRSVIAGANQRPIEYFKVSPAQGYWTRKLERSRFLCQPHWYFSALEGETGKTACGRHAYYMGSSGKGGAKADTDPVELFGKKVSDSRFTIAYLKEPDPVLEALREASVELAMGRYMGLMVGELREILANDTYMELEQYGDQLLRRDYGKQRLSTSQDSLLVREFRPARLVYQGIETINALEQVLQHHLNTPNEGAVRSTEITDILYEVEQGKKKSTFKLKGHITSALRSQDVRVKYAVRAEDQNEIDLTLTIGLDTPDRNTLAALAGEDTRVWVVTWPESQDAIRYATVVESQGCIGLWCTAYANIKLLPSAEVKAKSSKAKTKA